MELLTPGVALPSGFLRLDRSRCFNIKLNEIDKGREVSKCGDEVRPSWKEDRQKSCLGWAFQLSGLTDDVLSTDDCSDEPKDPLRAVNRHSG